MSSNPTPSRSLSDDDEKITPQPATARTPVFPSREDCWSEEATRTLIGAWGSHYLQLNRGNLRQKHWQSVADAVNAVHATMPKLLRTDVQCKNRVDTVKKKYKIEKSKILQSNGRRESTWPHFHSLDSLIGASFSKNAANAANSVSRNFVSRNLRRRVSTSPEISSPSPEKSPPVNHLPVVPWSVPVGPRSKRSGAASVTERNFSVMAAAAAAMEAEERKYDDNDDDDDDDNDDNDDFIGRKRKRPVEERRVDGKGYRSLAAAIAKLGEIYVKVEEAKQRQMVELEKQRMQFVKDLEIQRMKMFMESQVQIEKIKHNLVNNNGYV